MNPAFNARNPYNELDEDTLIDMAAWYGCEVEELTDSQIAKYDDERRMAWSERY